MHACPHGRDRDPGARRRLRNPQPSTSRAARIEELREYQATDSIQRYVILEQDSIAAAVFARHGKPVAQPRKPGPLPDRAAARATIQPIRDCAKTLNLGTFDGREWKAYRDEGRP